MLPIRIIRGDTAETSHSGGELEDNSGGEDVSMEDGEAEEMETINTRENGNEKSVSDITCESEEVKNFSNWSEVESNDESSRKIGIRR